MLSSMRSRRLVRAVLALFAVVCVLLVGSFIAARAGLLQKARAWAAERVFGEVRAASAGPTIVDPELFNVELVRHGRILQVRGQTSPDATVMINSYGVAFVDQGGRFNHYLDQLDPGEQLITITAQTPQGGVATFQQTVKISQISF
jgi:capsid protein